MAQIKIFQSETYSTDLHKVRSEILDFSSGTKKEIIEEKYINDYASSKLWDPKSEFGRIHGKLMNYLEGNDIVAYHNTRL